MAMAGGSGGQQVAAGTNLAAQDDLLGLIARLHRTSLLRLSAASGQRLQGLSQGSRALKLSPAWQRRLRHLDACYGIARKISPQSVLAFGIDLEAELARAAGGAAGASKTSTPDNLGCTSESEDFFGLPRETLDDVELKAKAVQHGEARLGGKQVQRQQRAKVTDSPSAAQVEEVGLGGEQAQYRGAAPQEQLAPPSLELEVVTGQLAPEADVAAGLIFGVSGDESEAGWHDRAPAHEHLRMRLSDLESRGVNEHGRRSAKEQCEGTAQTLIAMAPHNFLAVVSSPEGQVQAGLEGMALRQLQAHAACLADTSALLAEVEPSDCSHDSVAMGEYSGCIPFDSQEASGCIERAKRRLATFRKAATEFDKVLANCCEVSSDSEDEELVAAERLFALQLQNKAREKRL